MEWTETDLVEFIVEASRNTYANPDAKTIPIPYRPGCDEFVYASGDFRFLDSYAWKKDGGGEEIVYFKDVPIWIMNYYGFLIGEPDAKAVYAFLHEALRERHPTLPVRGAPISEQQYGFRYEVEYDRESIANVRGVERIFQNETLVYECSVHGGFVR